MSFWTTKNSDEAPDFWDEYLTLFNRKLIKSPINSVRFIALDTETTGFDYKEDRVLSIGAIAINEAAIDVSDQLELYLEQKVFSPDTVEIHGIRKNNNFDTIPEAEAAKMFIKYIGNSVLIAHHADFDKRMINMVLKRQGLGVLKNKFVDTGTLFNRTKHQVYRNHRANNHYSLDELCNDLKISKSDRHTASGDAFITAIAFLKIMARLKINKKDKVSVLL